MRSHAARWREAVGRRVVASPHPLATMAGLQVMLRGGTAVDAAVAAGATLAVVYPHMTGLGGDSFWLGWDARRQQLRGLAACGAAAARATPALYRAQGLDAIPPRGPLAALTVPGAVDGLWEAHRWSREALGSPLPWGDLLADAIRHAAAGFAISVGQSVERDRAVEWLAREDPAFHGFRQTYLVDERDPAGIRPLAQPRLGRTLERLAREGGRAFYEGELAAEIGRACEEVGSPLRAADLAAHRSRWVEPLTVPYRGGLAASLPPPSQGLALLAILGVLDALGLPFAQAWSRSAEYVHVVVEATKLAFADRDRWLADPDVAPVPTARLLDPAYLRERAGAIRLDAAAPAPALGGLGGTVACVAADAAGNAVSLIQSLYHEWGSGVMAGETGVVLQNRGVAFTLDPEHPNALAPGKRPFHTLTPFMWLRAGGPDLVAGTMGGDGQPQTLAAVATRVADHPQEVQRAVEAPRWLWGRTWGAPRRGLSIEERFGQPCVQSLRRLGHEVDVLPAWSPLLGHAQAIGRDHDDGLWIGAGDPRADGPALGA